MAVTDRLLHELRRIDLVLFYHVQKSRLERRHQARDEFRGLYISEEEIDELFRGVLGADDVEQGEPAEVEPPLSRIAEAIAHVGERYPTGSSCAEGDGQ